MSQQLREALERIVNPVKWEQEHLKEGYTLNGAMLVLMLKDPEYYKSIARDALAAIEQPVKKYPPFPDDRARIDPVTGDFSIGSPPVEDIHSCSYYCDRPECIKAQRDNMRESHARLVAIVETLICERDAHFSTASAWIDARHALAAAKEAEPSRPCTCHTDDRPSGPCRQQYAASECQAKAEPSDEPVPIRWTPDGDKNCGYSNWLGETPFGRILITWKGWKETHDACVDEFPGEFQAYGSPDEVKAACEAEFAKRFAHHARPAKPLTKEQIDEIERLQAQIKEMALQSISDSGQLIAEIKRLQDENRRLRASTGKEGTP